MAGTNFFSPITSTLDVALTDKGGYAVLAKCTGTPPTTANIFLHGCMLIQTDSGTGSKALYENIGSTAAPSWNLIGAIVAGELTLANTKIFIGGATGVAAEQTISGDAALANTGAITIAANAVTTAKIADAGVTPTKTKTKAVVALADAASTLTIAQMHDSGIFTITPTVARAVTTPTGAEIIAGISGYQVGTWFDFTIICLAAFAVTLTAGATGITLVGSAVVNNVSGTWKVRIDSTSAVTIYRLA